MKITNEFTVQIPVDEAWKVLTDLEGIAPCMPGARLTGVEGDVYQGKVKVKVGPVISEFAGTARFTAKDDSAYRAVIDAKGRDARSAGNASATVSASLTPEGPTATKVSVDTDLKISGKLAQFGSGMIKEVSSKLLAQFVANLESKLATDTSTPVAGTPAPAAGTSPSAAGSSAPAVGTSVPAAGTSAPAADSSDPAAADAAPAGTADAEAAPVTSPSTASEAAVATAPDSAVALGDVAPAGPANDDAAAPAVAPDPSAGEIEPAAGRLETAEGTPEPVAPLRVPGADLSAAAPAPAPASGASASAVPVSAVPASGTPVSAAPSSAAPASGAPVSATERTLQSEEPEAIDLLAVAGSSLYKRIVPVAVGAVVAAAVIVWFVARG
ncbi:SRPBCC family protein [Actinoplanes sp. CA-252034]|uniref:SRPBCC family protein n=1 Tax=Actinoplanes sp. CA-252034 TaxID=3239906 RepID=UPI003D98F674